MTNGRPEQFKVTVQLQRREDGGLRAWSDDVPGLTLSHSDPAKVLADIAPALEVIVGAMLDRAVEVTALTSLRSALADRNRMPDNASTETPLEYAARAA